MTIGLMTMIMATIGMMIGRYVGHYSEKAEIIGGLVLIGIGFNILFEHLNYLCMPISFVPPYMGAITYSASD